jgi:hypothetical protein
MVRSLTYARFALTFLSPWNIASETNHEWHSEFSVSGTIAMTAAEAEETAQDLTSPMVQLCSPKTSFVGWSYYEAGQTVASAGATYTPDQYPCQQNGYAVGSTAAQQLEVCALARCLVGKNKLGKNVYLRKWIHDVLAEATNPNQLAGLTNEANVLAKWLTGSGPHDVVPVDPTGGAQGGPWTLETHLYTHQLRRGSKRKPATASGSLLSDIEQALQTAGALKNLSELVAESGAG